MLCNHQPHPIPEHPHHPKINHLLITNRPLPFPQPWLSLVPASLDFMVLDISYNHILCGFSFCFSHLRSVFQAPPRCSMHHNFIAFGGVNNIPLCGTTTFVYPSIIIRWIFRQLPLLGHYE